MKLFFSNKFAVFCVLLILPLSCTTAPPLVPAEKDPGDYSYVIDYMTWLIEKEMKASKAMGLSVALIDGDELVWARGFGYRDKKSGCPAA